MLATSEKSADALLATAVPESQSLQKPALRRIFLCDLPPRPRVRHDNRDFPQTAANQVKTRITLISSCDTPVDWHKEGSKDGVGHRDQEGSCNRFLNPNCGFVSSG